MTCFPEGHFNHHSHHFSVTTYKSTGAIPRWRLKEGTPCGCKPLPPGRIWILAAFFPFFSNWGARQKIFWCSWSQISRFRELYSHDKHFLAKTEHFLQKHHFLPKYCTFYGGQKIHKTCISWQKLFLALFGAPLLINLVDHWRCGTQWRMTRVTWTGRRLAGRPLCSGSLLLSFSMWDFDTLMSSGQYTFVAEFLHVRL